MIGYFIHGTGDDVSVEVVDLPEEQLYDRMRDRDDPLPPVVYWSREAVEAALHAQEAPPVERRYVPEEPPGAVVERARALIDAAEGK